MDCAAGSDEEIAPAFVHYDADGMPLERSDGASTRVIAGKAFGRSSPVRTQSPLVYVHVELKAGASTAFRTATASALLRRGRHRACREQSYGGTDGRLRARQRAAIVAVTDATVMLLGGEPLGTRHIWWNFVSSRPERIEQAKADWRAGEFLAGRRRDEFIPLPEEPPPPPEPMS